MCVRVAEVDEVRELEDRRLCLLSDSRAVPQREEDDGHWHREERKRPGLRLRGDRPERAEQKERGLVWEQPPMQPPPSRERVAPDLERDDEVDERGVHGVLGDRREEDGP